MARSTVVRVAFEGTGKAEHGDPVDMYEPDQLSVGWGEILLHTSRMVLGSLLEMLPAFQEPLRFPGGDITAGLRPTAISQENFVRSDTVTRVRSVSVVGMMANDWPKCPRLASSLAVACQGTIRPALECEIRARMAQI